jgi:hypothetical protein
MIFDNPRHERPEGRPAEKRLAEGEAFFRGYGPGAAPIA